MPLTGQTALPTILRVLRSSRPPPACGSEEVLGALLALRDAPDRAAPELAWAWRTLDSYLDGRYRRDPFDPRHDDARQVTLLKVQRYVGELRATSARAAARWLRTIYENETKDARRRARTDPVASALRGARPSDPDHPLDRLAAPHARVRERDELVMQRVVDHVLDMVDDWLEANVRRPAKRLGDRLRAEVALLAHLLDLSVDEINERLGARAPSRNALYKWIERGRDQVLLPAVQARADDEDEVTRTLAEQLTDILEATRRSDAGQPRPGRRSVSRGEDCTSIQVSRRRKRDA